MRPDHLDLARTQSHFHSVSSGSRHHTRCNFDALYVSYSQIVPTCVAALGSLFFSQRVLSDGETDIRHKLLGPSTLLAQLTQLVDFQVASFPNFFLHR